jgi:hypothetical protein
VLDAKHEVTDRKEDEKLHRIELTLDGSKAFSLEKIGAALSVTTTQKTLKAGKMTIRIAGELSRRGQAFVFDEPAGLRAQISFESDEVRDKVAKAVGDAKVAGVVTGVVEQKDAFEPADPKKKVVLTGITVAGFEVKK